MSPTSELAEFITRATVQYRKGPEMTTRQVGTVEVVDAYAMPPAEDAAGHITVDVGFMVIGFTEAAADEDRFKTLLQAAVASPGEFYTFTPEEFAGGPSYINTGGWIGDQGLALRLYALLEHYGLAKVVTPARLGVTDDPKLEAELLGTGMVVFAAAPELRELLSREPTS